MFEVFWTVRCEGRSLNSASRRVGVDWATGQRWHRKVEDYFERSGVLDSWWCVKHREQVSNWRAFRWRRIVPWEDEPTRGDHVWFWSAHAAEVLFRARESGLLPAAEYHTLLKELTRRSAVCTAAWWTKLKEAVPVDLMMKV